MKIYVQYWIALSCFFGLLHADEGSYKILGIGCACIDISIQVDDEFLEQHVPGKKGGSCIINQEIFDQILSKTNKEPKITPGGSAANTITGLACLGEQCALFIPESEDPVDQYFLKHIQNLGVIEIPLSIPEYFMTKVLCLITPDGERTMRVVSPKSINLNMCEDHLKDVKLVHIEGYHIGIDKNLEEIMMLAKKSNCLISIDLSSREVVKTHKESLLHLIRQYVDIVFANEDEVQELMSLPFDEACLRAQGLCPFVVVMRGSKGCVVGHNDILIEVPTYLASPIDTTGAGDIFASGFLYGYLHDYPLNQCALIGNRLGSLVVEVEGALLPKDRWNKVVNFLEKEL